LIIVLLTTGAFARSHSLPLVPAEAVASINARELKMHLSFLAAPELGGRYTFSAGNRIAARYLAAQLESFGYHGAAHDGGFLQHIGFSSRALNASGSRMEITAGLAAGQKEPGDYVFGEDFFTFYPFKASLDISAPVVFVGYGISAPAKGYDDYAGLDLKGKIALINYGKPNQLLNKDIGEDERGAAAALAHGAAAALCLPAHDGRPSWAGYKFEGDEDNLKMDGEREDKNGDGDLPQMEISPKLARALLSSININLETLINQATIGEAIKPRETPLTVRLQVALRQSQEEAQNVVAYLEGSDAKLKKEYVMFSAHYDHLKSSGDLIYCGADDDGSGTAAVLTIAHALASGPPPKRSILIVFHTGEELGLYGSRYFTNVDPLVPLSSIVVDLNVDMIGRTRAPNDNSSQDKELTDKDSVYLIGADKHSSELNKLSEQTDQELIGMRLDYTYNDENHPYKLFYRSDHYNYARKGIPVIFYFTGLHADYHRSTDTIEKIDFEKMARIARLIYATGWRVANLDHRIIIDRWKGNSKGL
jgi:hypothetical protein